MNTPFEEVYTLFLAQLDDNELYLLPDEELEENLEGWLMLAIPSFHACRKNIEDVDTIFKEFKVELDLTEKVILAKYMVIEYLRPKILYQQAVSDELISKDYKIWSPANMLRVTQNMQTSIDSSTNSLQSQYSWRPERIRKWKMK